MPDPPPEVSTVSSVNPAQPAVAKSRPRAVRWLYAVCGGISLILGGIGIPVPGWPTTVFWLVAAWCFSRSCPQLQNWIYRQPRVGPVIADLLEHGRMSAVNKRRAILGIWLGVGGSVALLVWMGYVAAWLLLLIALVVSAWLWWLVPTKSESDTDSGPPWSRG